MKGNTACKEWLRMKRKPLIAALVIVLCLVFSGCIRIVSTSVDRETPVQTTKKPKGTASPAPTAAAETTEAPVAEPTAEPTAGPTPESEPEEYLHLDGMTVFGYAPFVDGIGWVQYADKTEVYTAAVEEDGHVLFTVTGPVCYASRFDQGTAFLVVAEHANGMNYQELYNGKKYSLSKFHYYPTVQTTYHEVILDKKGNVLYTTSRTATSTNAEEEHILCSGGGKFVVLRHVSNLQYDGWQLGTIDASGNTLDEFQAYSSSAGKSGSSIANESMLATWSGEIVLPNSYTAYGADDLARYVGDGLYYLPGSTSVLYQPSEQRVIIRDDAYNAAKYDKYWYINQSKSHTNALMYTYFDPYRAEGDNVFFIRQTYSYKSSVDYYYYNADTKKKTELTIYPEQVKDGSRFHGGYAILRIVGADKNNYITILDKDLKEQFEPFKITASVAGISPHVSNGYFVANDGSDCAVYDIRGNYIRHLVDGSKVSRITSISGNYVLIQLNTSPSAYESFEMRLYALNPGA